MKKGNIISLFIVILLVGYIFYSKYDKTPSQAVLTVVMTDQGFVPERVVAPLGATITWVNEGERDHWPASNFHPNHTLYPVPGGCLGSMLDACRGLKKGESFSFKFDKVGAWPMHDHLSPGMVMTVEIKEGEALNQKSDFKYDEETSPEVFRQFDYSRQLDFVRAMSKDSPKAAWAYIKEAFVVNGQVVGNAHELAHIIGNESYRESGIEGVKICDATFAFGCFHGVTEAMLLKEGPSKIKEIEKECLELFPPGISQDNTGCIHGTGHGIYTWEGGDLKKSLADCDIISEPYRQYCYDGVFMENSTASGVQVFDPKDPWKFCTDLNERYHRNCARYQSQVFLGTNRGADSSKVVGGYCAQGTSLLLRETCYESLGYYVAQNSLGDPMAAWNSCSTIKGAEGVAICTTGAAIETIFQKYGDYKNSANGLCGRLSEPRRAVCVERIVRMP